MNNHDPVGLFKNEKAENEKAENEKIGSDKTDHNKIGDDKAGMGRRVFWLSAWICFILVFMFLIGPLIAKAPLVRPVADLIKEQDIEANMFFYTEVEEFSDADSFFRDTMTYTPRSKDE